MMLMSVSSKTAMRAPTRKALGSFALVAFVAAYMALAADLSAMLFGDKPGPLAGFGYAFFGLIWIVPAGAIHQMMARPQR